VRNTSSSYRNSTSAVHPVGGTVGVNIQRSVELGNTRWLVLAKTQLGFIEALGESSPAAMICLRMAAFDVPVQTFASSA
jgi:hypothetical protein